MFEDCNDWALELYPEDKNKITELTEAYGKPYDAPKYSIYKQLRKIADGKEQGTIDGVNWVDTLSHQDQIEISEIHESLQTRLNSMSRIIVDHMHDPVNYNIEDSDEDENEYREGDTRSETVKEYRAWYKRTNEIMQLSGMYFETLEEAKSWFPNADVSLATNMKMLSRTITKTYKLQWVKVNE